MSKENLHFDDQNIKVDLVSFLLRYFLKEIGNMFFLSLSNFSINLLAFNRECCSLIGYATHYLFCER